MKPGKLPLEMLTALLARLPPAGGDVIIGPAIGEDAAALAVGDRVVVAGMDPITFATDLIGWYAVQVNANDLAVMGARPRWFLASLLLPPAASEALVGEIYDQVAAACAALDITLVGGHTEVTAAVTQPVVVGCMLGEVASDGLIRTSGARPGDSIILCGSTGIEGTALLAREAAAALLARGLTAEELAQARDFLHHPGLSIVRPARAAAEVGVTAMHDPTEGGIAGALLELALAAGVGLEIHVEAIPVSPVTRRIGELLSLDPLGLIASGALLVTVSPEREDALLTSLRAAGVSPTVIGRITPAESGLHLIVGGGRQPLPRFARDEVARYLEDHPLSKLGEGDGG